MTERTTRMDSGVRTDAPRVPGRDADGALGARASSPTGRRSPAPGPRLPDEPRCLVCGGNGRRVSGEFDGYIEGYRTSIHECERCSLRYSDRTDVPDGLYDSIYRHTAQLPGYDRYAGYARAVVRNSRPLDLLADAELPYWYVREQVRAAVGTDTTVVDLGCGEGYLTYALRRAGVHCVGVDLSTTTIRRARRRFGHDDWFLTSEEFARQRGAGVDLVVALEIIEHVADPGRFLGEALAAVRPGGSVLITTPNRDASPADAVWDTDLPPVHLSWFGSRSLRELADRTGCAVTFPEVPGPVVETLRTPPNHNRIWQPLLTPDGRPSTAVRRARSLPWRIRRRVGHTLAGVSEVLDRTPLRAIPEVDNPRRPTTLGALFTPSTGRTTTDAR